METDAANYVRAQEKVSPLSFKWPDRSFALGVFVSLAQL